MAALFGEMIGIAFQIKDDIFDYFENEELGKPTGNDMLEGKLTLPALYVLNNKAGEKYRQLALKIRAFEASRDEIEDFVRFVKQEGGIEYAQNVMYDYRSRALALLPETADESVREALTMYIDYVIERNK